MKACKRIVYAACLLVAFASCGGDSGPSSEPYNPTPVNPTPTNASVTGVSLNKTTVTLIEGDTESLSASVSPTNATNKGVSWKSSDESVVKVDESGKLTALKPGNATITVTTADGSKTATCSVTVERKVIHVESISLDKTTAEISVGGTITLKINILPEDAENKNVTWSSDNTTVATVDSNGKVTGVQEGTAKIIVKADDNNKTAECVVTVTKSSFSTSIEGLGDEDQGWGK